MGEGRVKMLNINTKIGHVLVLLCFSQTIFQGKRLMEAKSGIFYSFNSFRKKEFMLDEIVLVKCFNIIFKKNFKYKCKNNKHGSYE